MRRLVYDGDRPVMRSHDDYALNGAWHYCSDCDTRWSDADGGCRCQDPSEEEEDQDERELREWREERRKSAH